MVWYLWWLALRNIIMRRTSESGSKAASRAKVSKAASRAKDDAVRRFSKVTPSRAQFNSGRKGHVHVLIILSATGDAIHEGCENTTISCASETPQARARRRRACLTVHIGQYTPNGNCYPAFALNKIAYPAVVSRRDLPQQCRHV